MTSAADFKRGDIRHDAVELIAVKQSGEELSFRTMSIYALEELRKIQKRNNDIPGLDSMTDLDYLTTGISLNSKMMRQCNIQRFYLKAARVKCGPNCTHI